METVQAISLMLGAGWASGINLYAAMLVFGWLGLTGQVDLPPALELLSHPGVMLTAGCMYAAEFFADKVPGVDSAWDGLHTFIRIPAGALMAAGAATGQDRWAGNALRGEIDRISRLDPEERRRVLGNLGRVGAQEGQERLQQIGLAAAQRGQLRESLMGRGRGGRRAGRQRIESASQALGGLGMGRDFSIELGSGDRTRQVSGRRAQAMFEQYLSGGGNEESRAAVEAALQRQGDSMNMSDEMRNDMLGAIRGIATASSEEERAAAADVIQGNASTGQQGLRERYSADFQRIEEQRASRALAAAGRQDPLGQRRNEILERIANNTEATADSAPGPTGGQPGVNMSGGE